MLLNPNLHHFWSFLGVPVLGVFAGFLAILWAFALVGVFAIAALLLTPLSVSSLRSLPGRGSFHAPVGVFAIAARLHAP